MKIPDISVLRADELCNSMLNYLFFAMHVICGQIYAMIHANCSLICGTKLPMWQTHFFSVVALTPITASATVGFYYMGSSNWGSAGVYPGAKQRAKIFVVNVKLYSCKIFLYVFCV